MSPTVQAQFFVAISLAAAWYLPGCALVHLLRLGATGNPYLLVPLRASAGVLAAAVPSTACLLVGTSHRTFVLAFLAWSIALVGIALADWVRRRRRHGAGSAAHASWTRWMLVALGTTSTAIAAVRGTVFVSDSAVHASIVEKLVNLPGARLTDLGVVDMGRPIDSAILPAWHHLLALAATTTQPNGVMAIWSAGAAVAFFVPFAAAALGWAAVRTHAGAALAAGLTMALVMVPWGEIPYTAAYIAYPGNVTIYVVLPALLAALVQCLSDDSRERATARHALALTTAATCLLHLTYMYHVAVAAIGMVAVLAVVRPSLLHRMLAPAAIVAGIGGVAMAAALPFLRHAEQFNRGAHAEWGDDVVLKQWLSILDGRGNDIAPGYFLEAGGLAIVGLVLAIAVLPLARRVNVAGAMLAVGPLLALGLCARSDVIANAVAGLGSFPPIPRSYKVIPWVLSIVVLVDLAGRSELLRMRVDAGVRGAFGVSVAVAAMAASLAVPGRLLGRDTPAGGTIDPAVPAWLFDAALMLLAVQVLVLGALRIRGWRAARANDGDSPDDALDADELHGAGAVRGSAAWSTAAAMVVLVTIFGAAGAVRGIDERPDKPLLAAGLFGEELYPLRTVNVLRKLPPGSTVLADEGAGLRMAAVAPVYLPHVRKQSFSTAARREAYLDVVFRDRSDANRRAYLEEHDIVMVVLPIRTELRRGLTPLLERELGWKRILRERKLVGWWRPDVALDD